MGVLLGGIDVNKEIQQLKQDTYQIFVLVQGLTKEMQSIKEFLSQQQNQQPQTPVECIIHGKMGSMNIVIDNVLIGKYCVKCYDTFLKESQLKDFKECGI